MRAPRAIIPAGPKKVARKHKPSLSRREDYGGRRQVATTTKRLLFFNFAERGKERAQMAKPDYEWIAVQYCPKITLAR
jgi:hypothetical protein